MGTVDRSLRQRRHARASTTASAVDGRGTAAGHSPAGQFSENQRSARSSRPTLMSAPSSRARSFLPSSSARELTVESGTPSISAYARATVSSCSMPDMARISVGLPVKSTAILPGAHSIRSGHSTGVDTAVILTNIERRLKVLKISADEAARRAGKPDAIRNLRSGKTKTPRIETLQALAKALETTPEALMQQTDVVAVAAVPGMRELLLRQRGLIDEQLAALDEAESTGRTPRRRKIR